MSGGEALLVVGLIANIIQLIEFSREVINRIDGFSSEIKSVPESFRNLQVELPLLGHTLKRTKERLDSGELDDETCLALKPVIAACEQKLQALKTYLQRLSPEPGLQKLK
jgi:hypothetical protein